MKNKFLYLIIIVSLLLSACSYGKATITNSTEPTVALSIEPAPVVATAIMQDQQFSGDNQQGNGKGAPPAEAIAACSGKDENDTCAFTDKNGDHSGICKTTDNQFACAPDRGPEEANQSGDNGKNNTAVQPGGSGNNDQQGTKQTDANGNSYNIDQAISDKAQGMTIAFDALAFLTGDLGADSFFPPGKVADFWGFQYLRDNDLSQMGHAGDFLTSAAMNMLNILSADQRAQLVALATTQVSQIEQYGYSRFILIQAFQNLIDGKLPNGKTELSEDAVKDFSADLYQLDGEISYARAQLYGSLINSLDANQKTTLDSLKGKGMLDWPAVAEPDDIKGLDRPVKVAVMTYAADMLSWYIGSVDADVYFCPERHGTYFGSFYLKDIKAMSDSSYAIPTDMTGNLGDELLSSLSTDKAQVITGLVEVQKPYLLNIVDVRKQVSTELRKFLEGQTADKALILSLMRKYGEYDGEIIYNLAVNFTKVKLSLTAEENSKLVSMRQELLGDLSHPKGAYLYSEPIAMPEIPNSDFLFK
jgi:hypothetical protein